MAQQTVTDEKTRFLDLPNGRRIAYAEDGDPSGLPVIFCHGWPASRLQGAGFGPEAEKLGLRIISPDRPGVGLSTMQEGRKLLDWPEVVEAFLRELKLEKIAILGISGGGPYALAAAWALRERVMATMIVSGAPPLPPETDQSSLYAIYRWLLTAYRWRPELVRAAFRCARPVVTRRPPMWMWPLLLRFTTPADAAALNEPSVFEGSFGCYREAWRGSASGVVADAEIYAQDWGFAPEEIHTPVRIWHGKNDRSFHWHLARDLAERLPHCETRFLENEGHYSLPISKRREILEDLLAAAHSPRPAASTAQ